jgi:hypothetical protein
VVQPVTTGRNFGEEGGRLTYGGYLHLPELLTLQVPQSAPTNCFSSPCTRCTSCGSSKSCTSSKR